jgi:hypothetical protein
LFGTSQNTRIINESQRKEIILHMKHMKFDKSAQEVHFSSNQEQNPEQGFVGLNSLSLNQEVMSEVHG